MAMTYLTVQDVLLLSLKLTKSPQPFQALVLEEAVNYQYAPGVSRDLAKQGARFLTGFVKKRPFPRGNEACAFAGLVAFVEANGAQLALTDETAGAWFAEHAGDRQRAEESLRALITEHTDKGHSHPDLESICESVHSRFKGTLDALVALDSQASAV